MTGERGRGGLVELETTLCREEGLLELETLHSAGRRD